MEIVRVIKDLVDRNYEIDIKYENVGEIASYLGMTYDELNNQLKYASISRYIQETKESYERKNTVAEWEESVSERVMAMRFAIEVESTIRASQMRGESSLQKIKDKLSEFFESTEEQVIEKQYELYLEIINCTDNFENKKKYKLYEEDLKANMWHLLFTRSYKGYELHELYIEIVNLIEEKNDESLRKIYKEFHNRIQKKLAN